jgi:hypothetical protein
MQGLSYISIILALVVGTTATASVPQNKPSPYSVIIGDLVQQKDAPGNPCEPDEDLCLDVILETTLDDVELLAGNRVGDTVSVRHRAHVPYGRGRQIRLAMIVGPKLEGGFRKGIMLGRPEGGKICVDKSWFDPKQDGMRMPQGYRINNQGDICFRVTA